MSRRIFVFRDFVLYNVDIGFWLEMSGFFD